MILHYPIKSHNIPHLRQNHNLKSNTDSHNIKDNLDKRSNLEYLEDTYLKQIVPLRVQICVVETLEEATYMEGISLELT